MLLGGWASPVLSLPPKASGHCSASLGTGEERTFLSSPLPPLPSTLPSPLWATRAHAGKGISDAPPSVNWSMVGRCTRLLKESDTEDFLRCLEKEKGLR